MIIFRQDVDFLGVLYLCLGFGIAVLIRGYSSITIIPALQDMRVPMIMECDQS